VESALPDEASEPERWPSGIQEYVLPGGWRVLVGRTASANDQLSLRIARPNDRWFHIRGMPGSHVVLRVPEGATPDRATQELAAAIAAFHSKARSAGTVGVSCTEARHVSKPPNAKPGTVTIRKETVLKVQPLSESALAGFRRDSPIQRREGES
jgi:predicted ribosome quality control (RQC) complex YloA/Tae2 family protein